jgi:mono/diheme cytochrome c family protein
MKKVLKWIASVLGGLVFLVIVVALIGVVLGNSHLLRTYKIQAEAIIILSDAASIAQGKHIVNSVCTGCHGNDLSGGVAVFNAPPLGHIESANLTPGQGGKGGTYTDANWVLSIRHGIDEEGKSVLIMPSPMFYYFNDQNLADIIAYLKTVPPVDKEVPEHTLTSFGKILMGLGQLNGLISAENIDQTGPRPAVVQPGVSVAYGDYIVKTSDCRGCHRPDLAGAKNNDPKGSLFPT